MFETSVETTEIYKALLSVQNEFLVIQKNTQGKQNKFADYSQMIAHAKPIFTKAGLVLMQPITYDLSPDGNYQPTITTIIIHTESGQHIKTASLVFEMSDRKNSSGNSVLSQEQRVGGGITYMKRYALAAIMSWATGDYDLDQEILDRYESAKNKKPEVTPEKKATWDRAVASYRQEGNFDKVLEHADISEENQHLIIKEVGDGLP